MYLIYFYNIANWIGNVKYLFLALNVLRGTFILFYNL